MGPGHGRIKTLHLCLTTCFLLLFLLLKKMAQRPTNFPKENIISMCHADKYRPSRFTMLHDQHNYGSGQCSCPASCIWPSHQDVYLLAFLIWLFILVLAVQECIHCLEIYIVPNLPSPYNIALVFNLWSFFLQFNFVF